MHISVLISSQVPTKSKNELVIQVDHTWLISSTKRWRELFLSCYAPLGKTLQLAPMHDSLTVFINIKTVVAYLYALLAYFATTIYQKLVWKLGEFPLHSVKEAYLLTVGSEKDEVTWQTGQPCLNGAY